MITLKVKGKEYNLKFGYKSFKNSGILQEVVNLQKEIGNRTESEGGNDGIEFIGDVLNLTSRLVLVALQKYNEEFRVDFQDVTTVRPVIDEVDDLLDDYMDEEDSLSIMELFQKLTEELFNNGFLSKKSESLEESLVKRGATIVPLDHLKEKN